MVNNTIFPLTFHSKIIAKKYADKVLFIDKSGKIHFDSHLNLMENNLEYRDLFQEEVFKNES
jgi:ABC-type multidrug transport system fused ATPase/permease subunit